MAVSELLRCRQQEIQSKGANQQVGILSVKRHVRGEVASLVCELQQVDRIPVHQVLDCCRQHGKLFKTQAVVAHLLLQ